MKEQNTATQPLLSKGKRTSSSSSVVIDVDSPLIDTLTLHEGKIDYLFTGRVMFFPLSTLALGLLAGIMLIYGDRPYAHGYFQSSELYYGIMGLLVLLLTLICIASELIWLVFKISFEFDKGILTIVKHGAFRRSILQFAISRTSLHYYKTHFSEEQAWLQLVVREGNQFYQIFSWKGKGNQKGHFMRLFASLERELEKAQSYKQRAVTKKLPASIVSKKEIRLREPFASKLQELFAKENVFDNSDFESSSICILDVQTVNYDRFFKHFSFNKRLKRSTRTK